MRSFRPWRNGKRAKLDEWGSSAKSDEKMSKETLKDGLDR